MYEVIINKGKVASRKKLNTARLWVVDNLKEGQTAYIQYVPSYWKEGKDAEGNLTKSKKKDTLGAKVVGVMKYDERRDRYLWWPWNDKMRRQLSNRYGNVMAPAYIVMTDGSVLFDQETAHMYDKERAEDKVRRFSGMSKSDFEKSPWSKVIQVKDESKDWAKVMVEREQEKERKIHDKRKKREAKE